MNSFPQSSIALVQGASRGIGLGLVRRLLEQQRFARVIATCRDPERAAELQALAGPRLEIHALEITDHEAHAGLAERLAADAVRLNLVVNVAGILHGEHFNPEKKLEELDPDVLQRVFAVNAFGPILLLRHLRPHLARQGKAVFAAISARVGSISDNRLGGWYAYRASKAALNQFLKTAAIELGRRNRNAIVAALHPGTTDTALSAPFQSHVPDSKLFPVERTCGYLLDVIERLDVGSNGGFFAWDGKPIDW